MDGTLIDLYLKRSTTVKLRSICVTLFLLFVSCSQENSSNHNSNLFSFGDVVHADKRPNGNYNIVCRDGTIELDVPLDKILENEVCETEETLLDFLFVIDDSSPSMEIIVERIFKDIPSFLSSLNGFNWKIAAVTTSSSCLQKTSSSKKAITRSDYLENSSKAIEMLSELVSAKDGNPMEKGILMATEGLIGDCGDKNMDWKRKDSKTLAFIISDEKNCGSSEYEGCDYEEYGKAEYFINNAPEDSKVFGFFLLEDNAEVCPDSGHYKNQYPIEYTRLVEHTGGVFEEICQQSYQQSLQKISNAIIDSMHKAKQIQQNRFYYIIPWHTI